MKCLCQTVLERLNLNIKFNTGIAGVEGAERAERATPYLVESTEPRIVDVLEEEHWNCLVNATNLNLKNQIS